MVMIAVHDLVSGADSLEEGRVIAAALDGAIAADDVVILSFHGVGSASSSFISASIIPLLRRVGIEEFKRRVRVASASWQIADVIRRRIELELVAV
jgi:STAS-like domain of unknown function (DUF4325)